MGLAWKGENLSLCMKTCAKPGSNSPQEALRWVMLNPSKKWFWSLGGGCGFIRPWFKRLGALTSSFIDSSRAENLNGKNFKGLQTSSGEEKNAVTSELLKYTYYHGERLLRVKLSEILFTISAQGDLYKTRRRIWCLVERSGMDKGAGGIEFQGW